MHVHDMSYLRRGSSAGFVGLQHTEVIFLVWLVPLIAVLLGVPAQAPATPDPSVSTCVPWAPHDHSLHEDIVWDPIVGVFLAVACSFSAGD